MDLQRTPEIQVCYESQLSKLITAKYTLMCKNTHIGNLVGATAEANINDLHYLHPDKDGDNGQVKCPKWLAISLGQSVPSEMKGTPGLICFSVVPRFHSCMFFHIWQEKNKMLLNSNLTNPNSAEFLHFPPFIPSDLELNTYYWDPKNEMFYQMSFISLCLDPHKNTFLVKSTNMIT